MGIFNKLSKNFVYINNKKNTISEEYNTYPTPYRLLYINEDKSLKKDNYQSIVEGRATLKSILNNRLALLCGEGIQIQTEHDSVRDWVKKFLQQTLLDNKTLIGLAEQLELYGYISCSLEIDKNTQDFKIKIHKDPNGDIVVLKNDAVSASDQVTVLSGIVPQCINLERALKRLKVVNEGAVKTTPAITGIDKNEMQAMQNALNKKEWQEGDFLITTGSFNYHTPNTAPIDSLKTEIGIIVRDISSKTGIPPHWLGWTDLMNNRSTADALVTFMESYTQIERSVLLIAVKNIIMNAQEIAVSITSSKGLDMIDADMDVSIPTQSHSKFIISVQAYSILYNSEVITREEFRAIIPGLQPITPDELLDNDDEKDPFMHTHDDDELEDENE